MEKIPFWQGIRGDALPVLLFFLLAFQPATAGEKAVTDRQKAILGELESFRPDWAEPGNTVWMLSVWDTDKTLDTLVELPRGHGNAAACFALLEEYYPSEADLLQNDGADARGVGALLEAADMGECHLIPEYFPEFTSTEARQPDFQILRLYLQALLRRAERSAAKGDHRDAARCYRAALICGWHLTRDKSSSIVYVTGLIFKVRGAQAYAAWLESVGDNPKASRVKTYAETLSLAVRAFMWKANVALSEFDGFACLPSVVRIAREDAEIFWRKEAVVRLATLRYGIPDPDGTTVRRDVDFELAADEALAEIASADPDESVRKLALWVALHITPERYAVMRHEF